MRRSFRASRTFAIVGAVATLVGVAACSSKSVGGGSSGGTSSSGQPHKGGTLYMLGTGDVDFMDPDITYYTVGYENLRMWDRPLMSYPAVAGKTTSLVPDLAEAPPTVSNGGLEYTFTIRKGVDWNTSPARQVVAADVLRGLQRSCNPVKPSGATPDYAPLIVGFATFCTAFENSPGTLSAINNFMKTHSIPGIVLDPSNPLQISFKLTHPATYFPALTALGGFMPAPVGVPEVPAEQHRRSLSTRSRTGLTRSSPTSRARASSTSATRPGRPRPTRSARPTSTRSWSTRPPAPRPCRKSCRPTRRPPTCTGATLRCRRQMCRGCSPRTTQPSSSARPTASIPSSSSTSPTRT